MGLRSRDAGGLRPRRGPVTIRGAAEAARVPTLASGCCRTVPSSLLPARPAFPPLLLRTPLFLLPSFSSSILHCSSLLSSLPSFLPFLLWSRLPSPQCRPWTGGGGGWGGGEGGGERLRPGPGGCEWVQGWPGSAAPFPSPPPPRRSFSQRPPMPPEVAARGLEKAAAAVAPAASAPRPAPARPAPRPATGRAQPEGAARGGPRGLGRRAGVLCGGLWEPCFIVLQPERAAAATAAGGGRGSWGGGVLGEGGPREGGREGWGLRGRGSALGQLPGPASCARGRLCLRPGPASGF